MGIPVNPKKLSWVNPTQAKDPIGQIVAWDATTDLAGVQVLFDAQPAVSIPLSADITSIDLTTLAAYLALPAGQHILSLDVVTKEGIAGEFSSAQPFLRSVIPNAPTDVVLA